MLSFYKQQMHLSQIVPKKSQINNTISYEKFTNNNIYLVRLIRINNMNPKFLQQIFCLFTFWVLLPGKSFELKLRYIKKCQHNC